MKSFCVFGKTAAIALLVLSALSATTHASDDVVIQSVSPRDVFTPKGFDDNDNVQVILSGDFGNTCFHTAPTVLKTADQENRIYIENQVYAIDGCEDAMMYIPYTRVVDVGILPVGTYEVWVSDGAGGFRRRATLPIIKSKPSLYAPDDVLYAQVSEVDFQPAQDRDPVILIHGTFTSTCMSLNDIAVIAVPGNVVEVLPKVSQLGSGCVTTRIPYTKSIQLTGFPKKGDVLIHVRSVGGQSVNRVITELDRIAPGA